MVSPSCRTTYAQCCSPGERPLAWELAASFAQASAIGGAPRADVGFSFNPVAGGVTVNDGWLGGKLMGFSAGGAAGSIATHFERAMSTTGTENLLIDAFSGHPTP